MVRGYGYALAALLALGAGACVGLIGDGEGNGSDLDVPPIESESSLGPSDLRRLSDHELEASLRDLFGDADIDQVQAALALVPTDHTPDGFSTMALDVSSIHVDGYHAIADGLSDFYAQDPTRLAPHAACLADAADAACVDTFVSDFGRRIFRRPLSTEEHDSMMELFSQGSALSEGDGVRLVLLYMLQAPPFLYRVELSGDAVGELEGVYTLTDYELATRLSYFAWGTTPDDELLDAAASGELQTHDGLDAQVTRLFASDRAAKHVERFFGEWLETQTLPQVQQPDTFLAGIAPEGLAAAMSDELSRYVTHHVFDAESDYAELLTSNVSFITSDALATLYGVAPASVDEPVTLDATRAGLLTRPAMLLSGGLITHPIQRGARVRRKLMCEVLTPPEAGDVPPELVQPPPFDPDKTARERWTEQTSQQQCAGCHNLINPLGFALEEFDTLGRYRTVEPILDPVTEQEVNQLPVDANVSAPIEGDVAVAGAKGLGEALADSDVAARCFARQWLRYSTGRMDENDDRELLDQLDAVLRADSGSMLALFRRFALTPQFKLRKVRP